MAGRVQADHYKEIKHYIYSPYFAREEVKHCPRNWEKNILTEAQEDHGYRAHCMGPLGEVVQEDLEVHGEEDHHEGQGAHGDHPLE